MTRMLMLSCAALALAACESGPRDPRKDDANIFAAAAGVWGGGYGAYLDERKAEMEAALDRQTRQERDNLVLSESLSVTDAERRVQQARVEDLRREASNLERRAASARASSDEAKTRKETLDARRAELDAEADRILAGGDDAALEDDLNALRAEQEMLMEEYDRLASY